MAAGFDVDDHAAAIGYSTIDIPADAEAALDAARRIFVLLVKITAPDPVGTNLWCDADTDIAYDGDTYISTGTIAGMSPSDGNENHSVPDALVRLVVVDPSRRHYITFSNPVAYGAPATITRVIKTATGLYPLDTWNGTIRYVEDDTETGVTQIEFANVFAEDDVTPGNWATNGYQIAASRSAGFTGDQTDDSHVQAGQILDYTLR